MRDLLGTLAAVALVGCGGGGKDDRAAGDRSAAATGDLAPARGPLPVARPQPTVSFDCARLVPATTMTTHLPTFRVEDYPGAPGLHTCVMTYGIFLLTAGYECPGWRDEVFRDVLAARREEIERTAPVDGLGRAAYAGWTSGKPYVQFWDDDTMCLVTVTGWVEAEKALAVARDLAAALTPASIAPR